MEFLKSDENSQKQSKFSKVMEILKSDVATESTL